MTDPMSYVLLALGALNLVTVIALWLHVDRRAEETRTLAERVSKLETNVTYLPRHRELTEIRASLGQLASELSAMRERTEAQAVMLHSIQSHLLENR